MEGPLIKILLIGFLLIFFYLLGKSANVIVVNLKKFGRKLGLNMYFLGLILGLFTSLPEFTIGINSVINEIEAVSFGNLFGGTIVLLAFILGVNAVLNKKIRTTGHGNNFVLILIYIMLPVLFGMDGLFGIIDGIILIILYLLLMYKMYKNERGEEIVDKPIVRRNKKKLYLNLFWILAGITGLVIFSTLIVNTTEQLLTEIGISRFALGTILFAFGTNLPEITIALKSIQSKNKDLSYSSLLGSAAANPFLIGIFSFVDPLNFEVGSSYLLTAFFTSALVIILYFFYKSKNSFSRNEGFALVGIYLLFLAFQIASQLIGETSVETFSM